jgi:hypothetical protein
VQAIECTLFWCARSKVPRPVDLQLAFVDAQVRQWRTPTKDLIEVLITGLTDTNLCEMALAESLGELASRGCVDDAPVGAVDER